MVKTFKFDNDTTVTMRDNYKKKQMCSECTPMILINKFFIVNKIK